MAQNLDPTAEVSREYKGKLVEVHKPSIEMAVPDTLHRFDLDFDYSVFENPYKGSYEFSPYIMAMRPASASKVKNTFYLQAGAGYTLHPVLDLLWSPVKKGPFSFDVYADHRSYVGEYRGLGGMDAWNGYDMLSNAGADFGYDWKKASLDFGASYYGIADKDCRRKRTYNALDAYAALKSKYLLSKGFKYDISMAYRYAGDRSDMYNGQRMNEHDLNLDASFGSDLKRIGSVQLDLGVEVSAYTGALETTAGRLSIVPHYVYEKGILDVDLGVRLSTVISSSAAFDISGQVIYPDIKVNLSVLPEAMKLYAHIGGGEKMNTYASLIDRNHHVDLSYGMGAAGSLMNVTVERVSAVVGLEGRITSFFSYNLRGGYANYKSALLDAVVRTSGGLFVPVMGYSPYQKCFASFDWNLNLESLRFDGTLNYIHSWAISDASIIAPASFSGDISALYTWNKRINAGVDCNFAASRASQAGFKVPGYADLGVYAEYVLNRNLSFWLRGGNLLNMEIQRNLLYAEKGINFTAGICLNL